jgi:hypothetical protein
LNTVHHHLGQILHVHPFSFMLMHLHDIITSIQQHVAGTKEPLLKKLILRTKGKQHQQVGRGRLQQISNFFSVYFEERTLNQIFKVLVLALFPLLHSPTNNVSSPVPSQCSGVY